MPELLTGNTPEKWEQVKTHPFYEKMREVLLANGEEYLSSPVPSVPYTAYMRFLEDGNRSEYETPYRARRHRISELTVLTRLYGEKYLGALCDTLWAVRGRGAEGERFNRVSGQRRPLTPRPSRAATIEQGFGGVTNFFPGARAELSAIDDEVVEAVLGRTVKGRALAFSDQYISNAGQLYELMMGHDRWIADVRPQAEALLRARGEELGLCCHAYDLSTELIAREVGVVVTDAAGGPLRAPLDVTTGVGWIGYANAAIQAQVEPALRAAMQRAGLSTDR
jgi:hypothetical protein